LAANLNLGLGSSPAPAISARRFLLLAMRAEQLHNKAKCSLRLLLDILREEFRFFWVLMFSDWRFRERIMFLQFLMW